MTAPSSISEQVLAIPKGAGGVSGLGDTFAADPYTGTGRFRIPITMPPGHAGLGPSLALVYSSGAGAGVCGVGWSFGVGSVRRRTDKGIPSFTEDDLFLVGDDEVVPAGSGYYVLRTEGRFARIRHVRQTQGDFWAVTEPDGTRRLYGRHPEHRDGDGSRITAWHLSEIRDTNDNIVRFFHERHEPDQRAYLEAIEWADGVYRAELTYETRPDVLRSARGGVLETTSRRLKSIQLQVRRTSDDALIPFESWSFSYSLSPITGLSRLDTVTRTGFAANGDSQSWPPLKLRYAEPAPGPQRVDVVGHPGRSLQNPNLQLVDIDGDALPDILESTSSGWLVRRNLGSGRFSGPVSIPGPTRRLQETGVFLSDMAGEGFADLVTPEGYYPNRGSGFISFRPFPLVPSFDLEDPDARFADLDGDGIGDVLITTGSGVVVFRNRKGEGWSPASHVPLRGLSLPRLSDRWARFADMEGDGLADLVRISRGSVEVYQNLGFGHFSAPRRLVLPERLPAWVEPEQIQLMDLTGTGAADIVVRLPGVIWVFPNGCGERLEKKIELRVRSLLANGALESADLLGSGVQGLLLTDDSGQDAWTFYALWEGLKPDLLAMIDNGIGLVTTVSYTSSVVYAQQDRAEGNPWRYPLPSPIQVVERVTITDTISKVRVGQRLRYHEGYYDAKEREFRGFGRVEQWDVEDISGSIGQGLIATKPGTESSPPSRKVFFFDLGNGQRFFNRYFPVPAELPEEEVPAHPLARRALRGSLLREELYGEDGESTLPYQVIHHAYAVRQVRAPPQTPTSSLSVASFFPSRTTTESFFFERTTDVRRVTQTFLYDEYGRPTEVRQLGHGRAGTFSTDHEQQQTEDLERYTTTAYVTRNEPDTDDYDGAYLPAYLINRPSVVEVYGVGDSSDELLSRVRNFYDGDPYEGLGYPGSGTSIGVTRGRLSSSLALALTDDLIAAIYPSGAGVGSALGSAGHYLEEDDKYSIHTVRRQYDSRGMVTGIVDPNDNEFIIDYDSTHELFVELFTDALGHPTEIVQGELPFQVLASIDANGNRTEFTYNPLGLVASKAVMGKEVSGDWQGDTPEFPTEVYSYNFESLPVSVLIRIRQVREGATFDIYRYIAGFGHIIQERHTAEPDPDTEATRYRVTGWQILNHKGLIVKAFQPTFAASTSFAEGEVEMAFVETAYDPLGRAFRIVYPDTTFESRTYYPWLQILRDRNDNAGQVNEEDSAYADRYGDYTSGYANHHDTPTKSFIDALGRIVAVSEDNADAEHITRTVYNLRDEALEAWDARGLETPTWSFSYDFTGRRIFSEHGTATGTRYSLQDAAGNPVWSRDARGIEITRGFDEINRPLEEFSNDGLSSKLRRKWTYIEYDDEHANFQDYRNKNLFGRVEEARDSDGLRFFEYDWRGLPVKISHRFWEQKDGSGKAWDEAGTTFWSDEDSWDPEVDDTARGSISSWLNLPDLTDSTTITQEADYDAAGRVTQNRYPEGLKTRNTHNAAGLLEKVEVDKGSGWEIVVEECRYNARGQLTRLLHGNGVESSREYDPDIERITRIFTQITTGTTTHFQDLSYGYDPVGNPVKIVDNLNSSSYKANAIIPNTRAFTYDPRYRLIGATGKKHNTITDKSTNIVVSSPDPNDYVAYSYTYAYDEAGNFTRNDEYKSSGTQTLQYKEGRIDLFNGDIGEATNSDPSAGNFRYDANGNTTHTPRLEELAYTHDDQCRWVKLNFGGDAVRYFRCGDQRTLRFVQKGQVKALGLYLGPFEYHHRQGGSGGISYNKVVLHVSAHGRHAQVEMVLGGSDPDSLPIFFHHSDHLGSGHILTKDDGTLLSQEEFFPYGRSSDRRDTRNRYRFIGVERDEDTMLCLAGPRQYDPVSGRFLEADPIGAMRMKKSLFVYADANPIKMVDANGYDSEPAPTGMSSPGIPKEGPTSEFLALDTTEQAQALGVVISTNPNAPNEVTSSEFSDLSAAWVGMLSGETLNLIGGRSDVQNFREQLSQNLAADSFVRQSFIALSQQSRKDGIPITMYIVAGDPSVPFDRESKRDVGGFPVYDVADMATLPVLPETGPPPPGLQNPTRTSQAASIIHVFEEQRALRVLETTQPNWSHEQRFKDAHASAVDLENQFLATYGLAGYKDYLGAFSVTDIDPTTLLSISYMVLEYDDRTEKFDTTFGVVRRFQ